jgi:AcrR family transcriptional regulator
MQRPDEKKRQQIADAAGRLFATLPFHKVKLDDVAAEAGVGKGTLYIYFKSKEDLFFWLIFDAFFRLVDRMETELGANEEIPPRQALRTIVGELVRFSFENPTLFELARSAGPVTRDGRWESKRKELSGLIERTIRRGNADGTFDDPHPEITALCMPGLMRSVMLFGPKGLDQAVVTAQITRLVERGVCAGPSEKREAKGEKAKRNVAVATGRNVR